MSILRQPTSRKYIIAKNEMAAHIIENYDTDVTMEKIETWQEFDLYDWLESWGFAWDGNEWGRVGDDDTD